MASIVDRIPGMTDEDILVLFQNAMNNSFAKLNGCFPDDEA
jgi:hypothetical protein